MQKNNLKLKIFFLTIIFCGVFGVAGKSWAADWYVDNSVSSSGNGQAWATAWKNFSNIVWGGAGVNPGDTVYISGGVTSETYTGITLAPSISGTAGNSITITVGQESPHNGSVIIDKNYTDYVGISLSNVSYINISGQVGLSSTPKIKVIRANYSGISVSGSSHDLDIGYIEVTQNSQNGSGNTQNLQFLVNETNYAGAVHNCVFHENYLGDEVWLSPNSGGVADVYGSIKFYDNEIYNFHADGIKLLNGGVDFYDNAIHDRGIYQSDHPDGVQAWGGYLRIYNNNFYNFHRDDDNNVNSYIRYNPDGASGHDANPQYVWIYNNLFHDTPPFSYAPASVVTHDGNTYTCTVGHYASASKEPGVGTYWETYWSQEGTGGSPWELGITYNGPPDETYRRGVELSFGDPTLATINHLYFMNNTFYGIPFFGLFLGFKTSMSASEVGDIVIENNIFKDVSEDSGRGSVAVMLSDEGDGTISYGSHGSGASVIFDYNSIFASTGFKSDCSFSGATYSYADFKTVSGTQEHDVTANPDLNDDLSEKITSPTINAGISLSLYFTTDKSGISRPQGSAWDIGAYEYEDPGERPSSPVGLSVR